MDVCGISRKDCAYAAACALNNHLLHRAVLNINGLEPLSYEDFLAIGNKATGNHITYTRLTDDELYAYFDSIFQKVQFKQHQKEWLLLEQLSHKAI